MQKNCIRLLRWLLALHLCLGLAIAAESPSASSAPDLQTAAVERIQQASNTLDAVRQSLDDAEAPETLQTLSEKTLQSKRDADDASATLEPLLKQIDARIAQLGPVTAGTEESPELKAQRKELAQQRSDLDSAIKSGKLLSIEAKQAADNIEKIRTQQFNQQIARKVASPLSPSLWKQFAEHVPVDLQRIMALARQGQASFQSAIARHGWSTPLIGTLIALAMMFPLRIWLRGPQICRLRARAQRTPAPLRSGRVDAGGRHRLARACQHGLHRKPALHRRDCAAPGIRGRCLGQVLFCRRLLPVRQRLPAGAQAPHLAAAEY